MADYYSILNKTISGLKENTPELRQAVYAKARLAIENKIKNLDPFPGEEALARQIELLEEAVIVVEAEHGSPPPPVVRRAEEPAPIETPPSAPAVSAGIEQSVTDTPAVPLAPVQEPALQPQTPSQTGMSADLSALSADPVSPDPVATAEAPAIASPVQSATVEPMAPPETVTSIPEPSIASGAGAAADPKMGRLDVSASQDAAGIPEEMIAKAQQQPKKRGFGGLLVGVLLVGLLGGGAYAAWLNRDSLSGIVAGLTGGEEQTADTKTATSPDPEQDPAKEETRITASGEPEASDPSAGETIAVQPTPEPTLTPEEETQSQETDIAVVEPVEPDPAPETPAETEAENADTQNTETAAVEPETATNEPATLGEVAYLYEERGAGAGATRSDASISWKVAQVKPSAELPAEAVIVGSMSVPDKGLQIDINIKRNVDDALSASHIIELTFEVPTGFSGGSIENIARFVMKPTEEARGEPLVAVPVKVSDGYFLIALDNLQQAVQVNQQLLLSSGWIDIPVSYSSGKRALLTLAKGGTGQEVFQQAFNDWQTR